MSVANERHLDHAAHELAHPKIAAVDAPGEVVGFPLDMVFEEEDAFWGSL